MAVGGRFASAAAVAVVVRAEEAEVGGGGGVAVAAVVGTAEVAAGVASSARRGLVRGGQSWVCLTLRFGRSVAGMAAAELGEVAAAAVATMADA